MGHRSWMIPLRSEKDTTGVKRWLLNVEQHANVDWGLTFWLTCKRKDGSVWALVDSDGSGCIGHMSRYGYEPEGVRLLGEMAQWDEGNGRLGSIAEAQYSAFLDARADEFFAQGSEGLKAQEGVKRVFASQDMEVLVEVRRTAEALASKMEPRLIPQIDGTYFLITDAGARAMGLCVRRMSGAFLAELRKATGIQDVGESDLPLNTSRGFTIGKDAKAAFVLRDGAYQKYPLVGADLDESELIEMAHRNVSESFQAGVHKTLESMGFTWGGSYSHGDRRTSDFEKRMEGSLSDFMIVAQCKVERNEDGTQVFTREVRLQLRSYSSHSGVELPEGAPSEEVITEQGHVEDAVKRFESALAGLV